VSDVPHCVQKRAPGPSGAAHEGQVSAASDEPQFEQKWPEAAAPQRGQGTEVIAVIIAGG
jgi:hypothetical protein